MSWPSTADTGARKKPRSGFSQSALDEALRLLEEHEAPMRRAREAESLRVKADSERRSRDARARQDERDALLNSVRSTPASEIKKLLAEQNLIAKAREHVARAKNAEPCDTDLDLSVFGLDMERT